MKTLSLIWLAMTFVCLVLQIIIGEPLIAIFVAACIINSSIYNVGAKIAEGEK